MSRHPRAVSTCAQNVVASHVRTHTDTSWEWLGTSCVSPMHCTASSCSWNNTLTFLLCPLPSAYVPTNCAYYFEHPKKCLKDLFFIFSSSHVTWALCGAVHVRALTHMRRPGYDDPSHAKKWSRIKVSCTTRIPLWLGSIARGYPRKRA